MTVNPEPRPTSAGTIVVGDELLERDAELREMAGAIAAARGGDGRLVVVEGEAGIGKSTLLDAAAEMARRDGLTVLQGRGGELERLYVNGVVVDLFGPAVHDDADRARRLTGMAASAAPVFGLPGNSADPLATVHGLYWLTVNLATEQPLLIAVDDAHWADTGSLRFLAYLSRRLRELPIVVAITLRPPDSHEPPELRELRALEPARRLGLKRLTKVGVESILRRAGVAADPAVVDACWRATRGNPLYVREIATNPEAARALAAGRATPEPLALAVRHRIGLLDPEATHVAEAVAILGDEATPNRVARLADLPRDQVYADLRRLTDASMLERGDLPAFSHPIVRSSVYTAMPPVARGDAHRRAGLLLADEGASIDAVAAQLVEAVPTGDSRVVALLRDGARAARAQGEAAAATRYLDRALVEPPSADERPLVVAELAAAEAAIGAPGAAIRYQEALAIATSDAARAALYLELGHTRIAAADWAGAADEFRRGLAMARQTDTQLTARLEADYVASAWVSMTAGPEADEILRRAQQASSVTPEQRELLVSLAFQQATAVTETAPELAARVLDAIGDVPIDELVGEGQTVELSTGVLSATDELDAGLDLLTRAIDAVPRTGRYSKLGVYSYCRAWPRYFKGDLVNAAADAEAAVHAHELGWETFFPVASGLLAYCRLERGELDAAIRAVDAVDPQAWANRIDTEGFLPIARGRILLEQGDATRAAEQFLAAGAAASRAGMRSPGPFNWRSWAAVALARAGERASAHDIAAELLDNARRWGARWTLAVALRTMGVVSRSREGLDLLEESVELARTSPARLEEVRCLVELGEALRRRGLRVDARQRLAEAVDLAHRLGSRALLERAQRELRAAGGRPRRYAITGRDALTPSETRVAELVAAGRTNRQVAEALFVTPKAVEYHLANAYRKLGIGGRGELAGALREDARVASV